MLGDEELAAGVEVEDLVEQLPRRLELLAPHLHARVGDGEVDAAVVRHPAGPLPSS